MRISDWSSDVCSSDLIDACRGEFGLVGRIGEFLRFNRDAVALSIEMAVLADERAVEEVAGIDLHSRLGRQHVAHASARGCLEPRGALGSRRTPRVQRQLMDVAPTCQDTSARACSETYAAGLEVVAIDCGSL